MDKNSYALGMSIAHNMLSSGIRSVEFDDFAAGVKAVLTGSEPAVSFQEAGQLLDKYFAELEAEQKAEAEAMSAAMREEGEAFLKVNAKQEGVEFLTLHNPIEYIADEQGAVKQVVLQRMELGEPDASGRRSPVPVEGGIETLDVDLVVVAIGVSPNPIVPASVKGLETGRKGVIVVGEDMQSSIPMLYAGGDIVRGGATVILAMGDGKHAAEEMDKALN